MTNILDNINLAAIFIFICLIIALLMFVLPIYSVWAAHKSGQADLARAQNDQQIQVAEANSRLAAAESNKKASIVEAEGVAASIKIIGENLQHHDLYLRWQWIKMMEDRDSGDTIYVPTEANLPILEAVRNIKSKT